MPKIEPLQETNRRRHILICIPHYGSMFINAGSHISHDEELYASSGPFKINTLQCMYIL